MANVRMILPDIFERYTDRDLEDDGALFRAWRYKDIVVFDVSFYTDNRDIIYFNFRNPKRYNIDNREITEKMREFEDKYTSVSRDKLFKSSSAKEELEELCEILYQYLMSLKQ